MTPSNRSILCDRRTSVRAERARYSPSSRPASPSPDAAEVAPPNRPNSRCRSARRQDREIHHPRLRQGGLTDVALTNSGKAPHGAQFVLVTGGLHTFSRSCSRSAGRANSGKSLRWWMRAEGGVGSRSARPVRARRPSTCPRARTPWSTLRGAGGSGPPAYGQFDAVLPARLWNHLPASRRTSPACRPAMTSTPGQITGLKSGYSTPWSSRARARSAIHTIEGVQDQGIGEPVAGRDQEGAAVQRPPAELRGPGQPGGHVRRWTAESR